MRTGRINSALPMACPSDQSRQGLCRTKTLWFGGFMSQQSNPPGLQVCCAGSQSKPISRNISSGLSCGGLSLPGKKHSGIVTGVRCVEVSSSPSETAAALCPVVCECPASESAWGSVASRTVCENSQSDWLRDDLQPKTIIESSRKA
eukprot:scaffold601851_cov52-Prasinocladus_malaysianus.AAC.1